MFKRGNILGTFVEIIRVELNHRTKRFILNLRGMVIDNYIISIWYFYLFIIHVFISRWVDYIDYRIQCTFLSGKIVSWNCA